MKRKHSRVDLAPGMGATFRYDDGCRYVYITKGTHSTLKRGKPVKLEPGQEYSIEAESDIQVSYIYD